VALFWNPLVVFLAWFGYTAFATQFAVDDVVQRTLLIVQISGAGAI
jgi:hypothetical protein